MTSADSIPDHMEPSLCRVKGIVGEGEEDINNYTNTHSVLSFLLLAKGETQGARRVFYTSDLFTLIYLP
jgi:hypothetical protein